MNFADAAINHWIEKNLSKHHERKSRFDNLSKVRTVGIDARDALPTPLPPIQARFPIDIRSKRPTKNLTSSHTYCLFL